MLSAHLESATPLSLKEVSANFEQWRATRVKNSRIPEALWQQVIPLLDKYRIGEVSKALNLSGGQIKAKIQCAKIHRKSPDFVPVAIPQVVEESEVGKIEIKRADGAVLSIDRLNQATLTHLLTQFMRGL